MSQTVITLTFKVGGVLQDQSAVIFSGPKGVDNKGVTRTDNGATVVAQGTALPRLSLGVYQYIINPDPAAGLTYDCWFKVTKPDGTVAQFEQLIPAGTGNATSDLFTYNEFIRRWGLNNVVLWSQKDAYDKNNPTPDFAALQLSYDYATDEIYNRFRGTQFAVPFTYAANNGLVPPTVKEWGLIISADHVFTSRGMDQKNQTQTRFEKMTKRVYSDMGLYVVGVKQMAVDYSTGAEADMSGRGIFTRGCGVNSYYYPGWSWCCYLDAAPIYWLGGHLLF